MRILVTGGGGFVGLHLLRELLVHGGGEIFASAPELPGSHYDPGPPGVQWIHLDVASMDSVVDAVRRVRPDVVYHLAGQASVGASFEAPLVTWDVNATGTVRLLSALHQHSPGTRRLVLASSAEVYGMVAVESQPIVESSPLSPVNPYGASKAAAEVASVGMWRPGGVEVVIARTFNLIGTGQDERFVIPSIARQLSILISSQGQERTLKLGNLSVERDFLDVRDAVTGYRALMEGGVPGTAYNICSGTPRPLSAIAARLVELSGADVEIAVDQSRVRPNDIPVLAGANDRLKTLGWAPKHDLDETLQTILDEARRRA